MFCTYITEDVREHTEEKTGLRAIELEYFDNVKSCRYKEYTRYWFLVFELLRFCSGNSIFPRG